MSFFQIVFNKLGYIAQNIINESFRMLPCKTTSSILKYRRSLRFCFSLVLKFYRCTGGRRVSQNNLYQHFSHVYKNPTAVGDISVYQMIQTKLSYVLWMSKITRLQKLLVTFYLFSNATLFSAFKMKSREFTINYLCVQR